MSNRIGPSSPRPAIGSANEAKVERAPVESAPVTHTIDSAVGARVELNPARGNDAANHLAVAQSQKELFGGAAPVQVPPGLPLVPSTKQVNHGQNVSWTPQYSFQPTSVDQLSQTLSWVSKNLPPSVTVKAVGSRHSWSPTAATSGVSILPAGMSFVDKTPPADLRADLSKDVAQNLVRIGSGTKISTINQELWAQGKSIPVLGGFDGQTLGGVLPTGTHGSVLKSGPLVDMVQSVDLVTPDGSKVRIEPRNGITDPAAFAKDHPGWKLIQDDDVFNASKINMGTMGVVFDYVVKAVPKFYLNEVRTETTAQQAEQILKGGNIYNLMENDRTPPPADLSSVPHFDGQPYPAYHMELLWNPYTDKMAVTTRHPVDAATEKNLEANEPPYFAHPPTRNLFRGIIMDPKYARPDIPELLTEHLHNILGWIDEQVEHFLPHETPKLVDLSINSMKDGQYTQRSYNVFNIGEGANEIPAQSGTISVPLKGDDYLKAMDIIRDTAAKFAKEHGQYETGPISMRFVKGTDALLGNNQDVCNFECIFGGNDKRTQELSKQLVGAYYDALYKAFGPEIHLHWGQTIPDSFTQAGSSRVAESYPGFEKFEQIRAQFDPQGRFLNDWQKQVLTSGAEPRNAAA